MLGDKLLQVGLPACPQEFMEINKSGSPGEAL